MKLSFTITLATEQIDLEKSFLDVVNNNPGYDMEVISAFAKIVSLACRLKNEDQVSIVSFNVSRVDDIAPLTDTAQPTDIQPIAE